MNCTEKRPEAMQHGDSSSALSSPILGVLFTTLVTMLLHTIQISDNNGSTNNGHTQVQHMQSQKASHHHNSSSDVTTAVTAMKDEWTYLSQQRSNRGDGSWMDIVHEEKFESDSFETSLYFDEDSHIRKFIR